MSLSHMFIASRLCICFAVVVFALLPGCTGEGNGDGDSVDGKSEGNFVYATNEPTRFMTAKLLGDAIKIKSPDFGKQSPAEWMPADDEVRSIQSAKLIVDSGAKASPWMIKVTLPESKIVDLTGPVFDDLITVEDLTVHKHGPEGEHSHGGVVSQVWFDPSLLSKQAVKLAERLSIEFPDQKDAISKNLKELQAELAELSNAMQSIHASSEPIEVVSYSPVYKYLARAANLNDKHFHWDIDGALDTSNLEKLDAYLETAKPKLALLPAEPGTELIEQLKSKGIGYVVIDLCGRVESGGDYASRLEKNVERLKKALE